jgi:hypothetical protein
MATQKTWTALTDINNYMYQVALTRLKKLKMKKINQMKN